MTNEFKALFGVNKNEIHKNCLLLPYLPSPISKVLGLPKKQNHGIIYKTVLTDTYTLIITGMGCVFAADAILYLQQTACKNALLFGSCGVVDIKKHPMGSLILADSAVGCEKLNDMLEPANIKQHKKTQADKTLCEQIMQADTDLKSATALTVGSIKLEADFISKCPEGIFEIMEMELSAVYQAANMAGINAAGLTYVTDSPLAAPFYKFFSDNNRTQVNSIVTNATKRLKTITDTIFKN